MFNIAAQITPSPDSLFSNDYTPIAMAVFIFSLVLTVLLFWLYYRLFEKAGQAGWKALVPVYNLVVFLRLGGFSGWWILINLLLGIGSIIFVIILIIAAYNITLRFNKPAWYIVFYPFLQVVWLILLVLDKKAVWNSYDQDKVASSTADLPTPTPHPQPTSEVIAGHESQPKSGQPQEPSLTAPPATSAPIQDVMPPSNTNENRSR